MNVSMKKLLQFFSFLVTFTFAALLQAESLDLSTTNDVVARIEKLLNSLEKSSDSYLPMQLRLADLIADRARLYEVKDSNADVSTQKKAEADRKRAIEIYEVAMPKLKGDEQSRVLAQTAHLYQLSGNKTKAQSLFTKILSEPKKYSNDLLVQAHLGVAELALSEAKYSLAAKNFKAALGLKPEHAYVIKSRLAWTHYHNREEKAAVEMLETVLKEVPVEEASFREEVARDYASFLAHTQVTSAKIDFLAKNTPETVRRENLVFLAGELDRLGKKSEALYVWKYLGEQVSKSKVDYEEHLRLAQIQYDLDHKSEAATEIEAFVHTLKTQYCDPNKENCDLMRLKFRKLLTDWAKAESRNTSSALIQAYGLYLSVYADLDMSYWAAESAENIKDYKGAIKFYRMSSEIASVLISKEASHHNSHAEKIFEGSCMGEVDVAERLNDLVLRRAAYEHYIRVNSKGINFLSVRYQLAYLDYEEKKFNEAAVQMHTIALENSTGRSAKDLVYREKAADTSIEALIALNDQTRLILWSQEYSKQFQARQQEFQTISRNATLNQESTRINTAKSQDEIRTGLKHLEQIDLKNLSREDKLKVLKSKLAAAEKIKDLESTQKIAKQILDIPRLSQANTELALSRLEWVAEMQFHFELAYKFALRLKMNNLSAADRAMKLAVLAELAGKNPGPYYKSYLILSRDQGARDQVMAKLIRTAKNPKVAFTKYRKALAHNAKLSALLGLEIFAKDQDYSFANSLLKQPGILGSAEGMTIRRFVFIREFKRHKSLYSHSKLDASSPQKLKASLRLRIATIKQAQKQFEQTTKLGDWTLELMTLDAILFQEKNLALDIQNLPIPKNIRGKDRIQYKNLLAEQAAPYNQKVNELEVQISKLWSQGDFDHLFQEVRQSRGPVRSILLKEIKIACEFAPSAKKQSASRSLARLEIELSQRPSLQDIKVTQAEAQARPFDVRRLEQLKELQQKANNQTYVAYLDRRLSEVKGSAQ